MKELRYLRVLSSRVRFERKDSVSRTSFSVNALTSGISLAGRSGRWAESLRALALQKSRSWSGSKLSLCQWTRLEICVRCLSFS